MTQIECVVTASNAAGSSQAPSNVYRVPATAPISTQAPFVDVHTLEPASAPGLDGPEGGAAIAEQVRLTCLNGHWNRSDLSFKIGWQLLSPPSADALGAKTTYDFLAVQGTELDFDMRPGDANYDISVACDVVATTSNGQKSMAQSGPIAVWSGCNEFLASLQGDVAVQLTALLYAAPSLLFGPGLAGIVAGGLGLDSGIFNLLIPGTKEGVFAAIGNGEEQQVWTYGPNCLDYQHYWEGQGYTVKQQSG